MTRTDAALKAAAAAIEGERAVLDRTERLLEMTVTLRWQKGVLASVRTDVKREHVVLA